MSEFLDKLRRVDNITYEQILSRLLEHSDISMKTEILAPLELSILESIGFLLEQNKFKRSACTIAEFVEIYKQNMVSYRRAGRKEIINAIAGSSLTEPQIEVKEKK